MVWVLRMRAGLPYEGVDAVDCERFLASPRNFVEALSTRKARDKGIAVAAVADSSLTSRLESRSEGRST